MVKSKIIYIKSKVNNCYGLAGFRYEYDKLMVMGEPLVSGNTIYTNGGVFKYDRAISCELITKQEYQEETGDYSCDDVEFLSEYTDNSVFECDLDKAVNNGDYLFGNDRIGYFFVRINGEIIFHARKRVY